MMRVIWWSPNGSTERIREVSCMGEQIVNPFLVFSSLEPNES